MNSGRDSDQGDQAIGSAAAALPPDFPAGLGVLLVEDDHVCRAIIGKMLQKCMYKVKTCRTPESAMATLQMGKHKFDLVLSNVYMPDTHRFKLLESIRMEMDIPVIMMSSERQKDAVLKAVVHGACDYLIKPMKMELLKNIWQHVVRKKKEEECQQQSQDREEKQIRVPEDGYDSSQWREVDSNGCAESKKDEVGADSQQQAKKKRVVWTDDLKSKFVGAVKQLGLKNAVPKKILELMEDPELTRANVASHLQKFRINLGKEQQQQQQQQQAPRSNFQSVYPRRQIILSQNIAAVQSRRRMRMNSSVENSAIHKIGRDAQAAFPPTVGSASMQQMNNIPMNQLIGGSDNTNLRDYGGSYSVVQSYGNAPGYFSPLPSPSLSSSLLGDTVGQQHNNSLLMHPTQGNLLSVYNQEQGMHVSQGNLLSVYNQEQGMHVNLPRPPNTWQEQGMHVNLPRPPNTWQEQGMHVNLPRSPNPWQEQLVHSIGSHEPIIVPTTSTHQGLVNNLSSQVEVSTYNASAPTTLNGSCHADATFYHDEAVAPPLCPDVQDACTNGSSESINPMELFPVTTEPQFTATQDRPNIGLDDLLNTANQEQDGDVPIKLDDVDCDFDSIFM